MKILTCFLTLFLLCFCLQGYSVVQHLAAPVIATENAAQALEHKKQATRLIQQIQNQQNQRQKQMDNIMNPRSCPQGENCPSSP